MTAIECDVIGCGNPAAWVRSHHLNPDCDDFLCTACLATLRCLFPEQAADYVSCAPERQPFPSASEDDEIIIIA